MKLSVNDLKQHLQAGLAPTYIISSDEALLRQEAVAYLFKHAQQQGFDEITNYHHQASFNWDAFLATLQQPSLFNQRQLFVLDLTTSPLSTPGKKALLKLEQQPDTCLCLVSKRIDATTQKQAWFKHLTQQGAWLPLWPPNDKTFPAWLHKRLARQNLQTSHEGIALLVQHTQGNLSAAKQEIEKLNLCYGEGELSAAQIAASLSNHAQHNVFALIDAILANNSQQQRIILLSLQQQQESLHLILWGVCRLLRQLIEIKFEQQKNGTPAACFKRLKIWDSQQQLYLKLCQQHDLSYWHELLAHTAIIDQQSKGLQSGQPWQELLQLCLQFQAQEHDLCPTSL